MEELSDDGELPVEVEIMDSKTSELVAGNVRYIEEYRVGPKMNRILYICQRNGQCVRPCDENCLYTSDFFKSKMYHDSVKRVDTIPFLVDEQGNIWEVDMTWDKNLPKEMRRVPELMVGYKYETLEKWEMEKRWKTLEKIGKKVSVSLAILALFFLAFYAAGFIEARWMNSSRHAITINSSFFDRNPKEIAEGFKKYIEENKGVNVKEVKINKGEIRITTDVQNDTTFDEVEYILTKDGIQCMYKSNTNMDEDRWKQLIVNDNNFELN